MEDAGDPALYCPACTDKAGGRNRVHAVPVRFIVMCQNGHLDEFPWGWWLRHKEGCSRRGDLEMKGSATAGLVGLILTCLECGAKRSMEGCFGPDAIPKQCQGKRPWLGTDADEQCTVIPHVVQRGASNTYFSVIESSLDIPPWSDELQKKIGMRWAMLEKAPDSSSRKLLVQALRLAEITGRSEDELLTVIEDRIVRLQSPSRNLRWEEYQQFVQHNQPFGENTEFEIRPAIVPSELGGWLERVVRATRLREIRALRGFTRVLPPTPGDEDRVAKISSQPLAWLPAVENRGEGIFVQLRIDKVREWEENSSVQDRAAILHQEHVQAWQGRGRSGNPPNKVSPRLLLIHSLAHALIRQLALSSGYGSASLRERLYVGFGDWEMAGLLIFTSSPDADGTLGGLSRQGSSRNIVGVFEDSLSSMTWCSSDPLCIEGIHSLSAPGSGAACHSCLLASETSCEEFNAVLDRAMLVGTPTVGELGYFHDYLRELRG